MIRGKKASLSLSINAIVILVLAITMLGLGLAFTKGMFGKLSSKLSVPEPDIPATADDQIVLSTDTLNVQKNKDFIFTVNVYNDLLGSDAIQGTLICPADTPTTPTTTPSALALTVVSAPQKIASGESKGFKFIIKKEDTVVASTRICSLSFKKSLSTLATDPEITEQVVVAIK